MASRVTGIEMRMAVIGEQPRTLRLEAFESVYDGRQYGDRRYPWEQEQDGEGSQLRDISLDERRPPVFNLGAYIVDTSVRWMLGGRHWPTITASTPDGELDPDTTAWIAALAKLVQLPAKFGRFATEGGGCGSAAIVFSVRDGHAKLETLPAKYCLPTMAGDGVTVTRLRYQFKAPGEWFDEEMGYDGLRAEQWYWYRAVYDTKGKTVYNLVPVTLDGSAPDFERAGIDTERTYEHGLGICPVVWAPNLPSRHAFDGLPSYWSALDLLDPHNMLVAVAYRSIRKLSDPTLLFTQIEDPEQLDRLLALGTSAGNTLSSPGDGKFLEIEGRGQEAARVWGGELRGGVSMLTGVPQHDPEKLAGGSTSGYALEILHGPLLALVDILRQSYGPALERLVKLMLQVVRAMRDQEIGLLHGFIPPKGEINPEAVIGLAWGPAFKLTEQDKQQVITNLAAAVREKLLSRKTAQDRAFAMFEVTDFEAERKQIEAEAELEPSVNDLLMAGQGVIPPSQKGDPGQGKDDNGSDPNSGSSNGKGVSDGAQA